MGTYKTTHLGVNQVAGRLLFQPLPLLRLHFTLSFPNEINFTYDAKRSARQLSSRNTHVELCGSRISICLFSPTLGYGKIVDLFAFIFGALADTAARNHLTAIPPTTPLPPILENCILFGPTSKRIQNPQQSTNIDRLRATQCRSKRSNIGCIELKETLNQNIDSKHIA